MSMPLVDNPSSMNYMDIGHEQFNYYDQKARNGLWNDFSPQPEFQKEVIWWIDTKWKIHQSIASNDDTHLTTFDGLFPDDAESEQGIAKGRYANGLASLVIIRRSSNPRAAQFVLNKVVKILEKTFGSDTEIMQFQ